MTIWMQTREPMVIYEGVYQVMVQSGLNRGIGYRGYKGADGTQHRTQRPEGYKKIFFASFYSEVEWVWMQSEYWVTRLPQVRDVSTAGASTSSYIVTPPPLLPGCYSIVTDQAT